MIAYALTTLHALAAVLVMLSLVGGSVVVMAVATSSARSGNDDGTARLQEDHGYVCPECGEAVDADDSVWCTGCNRRCVSVTRAVEVDHGADWERYLAQGYRRVRPSSYDCTPVRVWEV